MWKMCWRHAIARDPKRPVVCLDEALKQAKRLAERIELHHTPKHGSWLNGDGFAVLAPADRFAMAEIEVSALGRQCLARRIAQPETLRRHVAAWEEKRNAAQAKVNRHTTNQARVKLHSPHPSSQE